MDEVLALINLTKPIIKGEFGQHLKEGYKENESPTLKPVAPVPSLSLPSPYWKPSSIEETPLVQHHNPIFNLQEDGEHPNTQEPMNTQEVLNTVVASRIQLKEDVNRMMQQFQNLKSNQEEDKIDHDPPAVESEKKINERMNNMEEMIRRARKMEDIMDYDSLSLFPNARLPPKFKMPTHDKFDGIGCLKSYLKMYMKAMQPLGGTEEVLAQMFQGTLTGSTFRWILNLDDARTRS
ncbi:hypothetical protein SO802_015877 [Lithocarpus litseifolius]|uniref:Gag-pro-like protein n=1 Tax=Lithocarpus litseifolius TaxID=425828 RepID=A0AAW2CVL5_9ROSI